MSFQWLEDGIEQLESKLRSVFALGCAERVLPIYENLADPRHETPRETLELGWAVVLGQADIVRESERAAQLKDEFLEILPDTDEESGASAVMLAGSCCFSAFVAALDGTAQTTQQAAFSALDAVENLMREDETEENERLWQKQALQVLGGNPPIGRDVLKMIDVPIAQAGQGVDPSERYCLLLFNPQEGEVKDSVAVGVNAEGLQIYASRMREILSGGDTFAVTDRYLDDFVVSQGLLKDGELIWTSG